MTERWVVILPYQGLLTVPGGARGYVIEHEDEQEARLEAAGRLIQETVQNAGPPDAHRLLARHLAAGAVSAKLSV